MKRALLVLPLLVAACTVPASESESDEDLGTTSEAVQFLNMFKGYVIVQDRSTAAKATGALEVPIREGGVQATTSNGLPVRGTCGVTFISPHYAITASHCVDSNNVPDPTNNPILVHQYDVSGAELLALAVTSVADGYFPNIHPRTRRASSVAGYQISTYSCKVVSRCQYGAFNCTTGGDVAMLHCGDRPSNASWLPVASSDPMSGPVDMYWFHELLSIPNDAPSPTSSDLFSQYQHYTLYPNAGTVAGQKQNWHYVNAATNDLLPLKSVPFQNGTPRTRLGLTTNGVATDMFGCHGTSGSGVLQRNAAGNFELLGPVRSGGGWVSNRLCDNGSTLQPGQLGITYEQNTYVNSLQSKYSRSLMFDRSQIIYLPPGGGVVATFTAN